MDLAEAKSSCNQLAELVYRGPGHNPELLARVGSIIRRLQATSNSPHVHERALYALCSFEEWFSSTRLAPIRCRGRTAQNPSVNRDQPTTWRHRKGCGSPRARPASGAIIRLHGPAARGRFLWRILVSGNKKRQRNADRRWHSQPRRCWLEPDSRQRACQRRACVGKTANGFIRQAIYRIQPRPHWQESGAVFALDMYAHWRPLIADNAEDPGRGVP